MSTLKEYWKLFLSIIIFIFLFWVFPSYQKKYYLERDLIQFSINETLVITGIVFFISWIAFYLFLHDEKDKFIRIAQSFAQSVFIGFLYAFIIQSIIISFGLFVNRLSDQMIVWEKFKIVSIRKDGSVKIKSLKDGYSEITNDKFTIAELEKIEKNTTVRIRFHKGVLGKKYLDSGKIKIVE